MANCDYCSSSTTCQSCTAPYLLYTNDGLCYASGSCPGITIETSTHCIGNSSLSSIINLVIDPSQDELTEEDQRFVDHVVLTKEALNTMTQTGLSVQTLIRASNPTVITATCVAKIIDYTRYVRISHSRRLEGVFAGYKQPPGVINTKQLALSSKIQSKVSQGVPPAVFERYHVSTNCVSKYLILHLLSLFLRLFCGKL